MRIYTLTNFKRVFHLSQKIMNHLVKKGIVELQQSGFLGHNLAHNKIVIIRKFDLLRFFMRNDYSSFLMTKSPKRISKIMPIREEPVEEEEIFDFVGYQEAILDCLPGNLITEELCNDVMFFVTEVIENVESDRNFQLACFRAEQFLDWKKNGHYDEDDLYRKIHITIMGMRK